MLLAAKGLHIPSQVTQTFTSSQTWVAPAGVTLVTSLTGKGQDGAPDTTYTNPSTYTLTTTATEVFDNGASTGSVTSWTDPATETSSVPAFYCTAFGDYTLNGHYNRCFCYEFAKNTIPGASGGSPATTGADTVGFGHTFAGGYGGAAETTTYNNVSVTPGTSYTMTIPSGGSITIIYFQ